MKHTTIWFLSASLLGPAAALAQQPAAAPHMQRAPAYGAPITLAQAERVADAAAAAARQAGAVGAVIAVVQPDGSLVYFEKFDGATYVSIEFAQVKARSAAVMRAATGPRNGPPGPAILPDLISLPGGLPIVIGGRTVGAIGVSGIDGVPGWNDTRIGEAGLAAVK